VNIGFSKIQSKYYVTCNCFGTPKNEEKRWLLGVASSYRLIRVWQ